MDTLPAAEKVTKPVSKSGRGGPRPNSGGRREGAGRKKGVPNKITGDVKAMILKALANKGGVEYLEEQADKNPVAFLTLIGKVLPMTLAGDPDAPIELRVTKVELVAPVHRTN